MVSVFPPGWDLVSIRGNSREWDMWIDAGVSGSALPNAPERFDVGVVSVRRSPVLSVITRVQVLLWPVPLLLGGAGVVVLRLRSRRVAKGACTECGYSLVGLERGASCPECGKGAGTT